MESLANEFIEYLINIRVNIATIYKLNKIVHG